MLSARVLPLTRCGWHKLQNLRASGACSVGRMDFTRSCLTVASMFIACWTMPARVIAQLDNQPLRIVVTHVQDRSDTDDHLWLRELLANQMRLLMSAAGAEIIDYRHLSAIALEGSIEDTGLPGIFADDEALVAAPDMTLSGEYRVTGERIEVSFVLAHVDPPEAAAQVRFAGELSGLDHGLRQLALELWQRAEQPAGEDTRTKLQTMPLPAHSYSRWMGEAKVYAEQGHLPEAWYCTTQALREQPGDMAADSPVPQNRQHVNHTTVSVHLAALTK